MAHMGIAGTGLGIYSSTQIASGAKMHWPPVSAQRYGLPSNPNTGASCSGRQLCDVTGQSSHQRFALRMSHRRAPRRDLSAKSAQTRHFNISFDPSKSNIPQEYNFEQPMSVRVPEQAGTAQDSDTAVVDVGPYVQVDPALGHPKDDYWRGPAPEGSFTVGNAFAQRTRLTPLRVPELGATGPRNPLARILSPFPKEEYYAVEMELNYGRELPRLAWQDGRLVFRPGFLQLAVDPDVPPYWLHKGIARFAMTVQDRTLQAVAGGLYLAAVAALAVALAAFSPPLLVAVAVSWARNTLSLAKWAVLLALAAYDRLYLYWVFLAAKLLDGLLARHAAPLRSFCWANFALWSVYLAFSPTHWPLLPGISV